MSKHRWMAAVSLAALAACASTSSDPPGSELTWPPPGVSSPGEVVWIAEIHELQPDGGRSFWRAVAGEPRGSQRWTLSRPIAVAGDDRRMAIVDSMHAAVFTCDLDGRHAHRLELEPGFTPIDVAVSADGERVLVVDRDTGAVHSFSWDGSFSKVIVAAGATVRCGGLTQLKNGTTVLSDAESAEVIVFDTGGAELHRGGGQDSGPGRFNHPAALRQAPDGSLWIVDTFNFRLQQLDSLLNPASSFGQLGRGTGHFALPKGLAIDHDGHLYVSDARFDVIQVFDKQGRLLLVIGGHGSTPGQFLNPAGLHLDRHGTLLVADTGNHRVQVLRYRRREGRP